MGASIVSCGDPPPVLDPAEHILDTVSLFVERFVVGGRMVSLFTRRNAGRNTFLFQSVAEPVGVVAAVGEQFPGFG